MTSPSRSHRIFVSHANADKEYVDGFVANVLMRGAGLRSDDIFYSSAADTGVLSGETLMEAVRKEAASASLIVALVTPWYQSRPVCVAELGAAWARDVLMPLMAPGMPRSELEGVLPGLAIRSAEDTGALNDLAERIRGLCFEINMRSWGVGMEEWKSFLRRRDPIVETPQQPTREQVDTLSSELDSARAALDDAQEQLRDLTKRFEALKKAKTDAEVSEASLPTGERERFDVLRSTAQSALTGLPSVVSDVIWHDLSGQTMYLTNFMEDPTASESAQEEIRNGRLDLDENNGSLAVDIDYPDVESAVAAARDLADFLDDSTRSEEFTVWFRKTFDVPMNLAKKGCWDAIL